MDSPAPPSLEELSLEFAKKASSAGASSLSCKNALVLHHYDADGIAAASVIGLALKARSIPFRMLPCKRFDDESLRTAAKSDSPAVFVADLASDRLNDLNAIARLGKFVSVVDHHPPAAVHNPSASLAVVNPHRHGLDGALYACSSTSAYLAFCEHVPIETARRMAQLALAGICGDMQPMEGANALVLRQARLINAVRVERDLRLFGLASRSLIQLLSQSGEPFLPGLTGSDKASALFLRRHGIPLYSDKEGKRTWLRYCDLEEKERRRLVGALASDSAAGSAVRLVGDLFYFPGEDPQSEASNAQEFASLLNACGRQGRSDLAVALCMGEGAGLDEARALLQSHKRALGRGFSFARSRAEDLGAFYFADARGDLPDYVVGTIAGSLAGSFPAPAAKPVVIAALDETGRVKVSARAARTFASAGGDLGRAVSAAAVKAGGFGGGHSVAAGAWLADSPGKLDAFLLALGDELRQGVKGRSAS
ncbi:MAG: DHH family phosphoesterase [Candidatus Micrarchaeota archaeon]